LKAIQVLDVFTLVVMTFFLILSIKGVMARNPKTVYVIYWIIYLIYGYSYIYNLFTGGYQYARYLQGFIISSADIKTCIVTDLFLIFCPFVLFISGKDKIKEHGLIIDKNELGLILKNRYLKNFLYFVLWIVMAYPLLLALFSGYFMELIKYSQVALSYSNDANLSEVYGNIFSASFLSVVAVGAYIVIKKRCNLIEKLFLIMFLMFSIVLNGKRNILFIAIIVLLGSLFISHKISKRKLFLYGILSLIAVAVFSWLYTYWFKGVINNYSIFTTLYVDIGRTDRLRMVIYSLLHPEQLKILDYPGQTVLYNLFFFIPRAFWPAKGYPFYVYFTFKDFLPSNAVVPYNVIMADYYHYLMSGITTGFFDEMAANFSWIGLIVVPFIIAKMCKFADKSNIIVKFTTFFILTQLIRTAIDPRQLWLWIIIAFVFHRKRSVLENNYREQVIK
jgi:hypothetical protein